MKKNRIVAVLSLSISLFIFGCMGSGENSAQAGQMKDFTLSDLQNKKVSLQSVLGAHKAVLVNFWATWCPPCREEIPGLIELQKKYQGQGFTVLGVDVGESLSKVEKFSKKNGINYPVLLDKNQAVAQQNNIVGIPTSFLVASNGTILGEYHAYTPELVADVKKAIQSN